MSILDTDDGALSDWSTSCDAMRWTPEGAAPKTDAGYEALRQALTVDMTQFTEAFRSLEAAFRPVIEAQVRACAKFMHEIGRAFYPKQHQRCYTCHPWRKPKPLAVNGHEYQRRLRARRRRR